MWDDLRFVFRQLARNTGFAATAVLSLALGVGVNSTIFSVIDGLYLRPLAVPDSGRLARLFLSTADEAYSPLSFVDYQRVRREAGSYSGVASVMNRGARLEVNGVQKLFLANITSPDFFQVLGVTPALGRLYGPGPEQGPVALLGHQAFQRIFGGDPSVVGRSIRLTEAQVTIIGVLPPSFRETGPTGDRDFWVPPDTWSAMIGGSKRDFSDPENRIFETLVRLKPGTGVDAAQSEADALSRQMQAVAKPGSTPAKLVVVSDLRWRLRNAGVAGAALLGIVLLVILTACVNVANLLLARAEARKREVALRAAMGASRWPVARLFLLESMVLGILGLALGIALSVWTVQAMPTLFPPAPGVSMSEGIEIRVDGRVFAATAAMAFLTVFLVGFSPLVTALRLSLTDALRGANSTSGRRPLRHLLAAAQVALSLVLLAGAGVLGASFLRTRTADIGLTRKNPLVVWCTGERDRFRQGYDAVRALPGVKRIGIAMRAPFSLSGRGMVQGVSASGHPALRPERPIEVKYNSIDENFLAVMGQRILRGRGFESADMSGAGRVMLINETMARRYWPGEDPVGRFVSTGGNDTQAWQVVGVVNDAPFNNVADLPEPYLYLPYWNATRWEMTLLIEPAGDRATLLQAVRTTLRGVAPTLEPASMTGLDDLLAYSTSEQRTLAVLAGALASLGLLLTAVGLYGVLSYTVTRRRREIGIRMALGATRTRTLGLVLRQSMTLVLAGGAAGLPLAFAATHAMRSFLFGISPWHAPAFGAAMAALLLIAAAACILPARRASSVDPTEVLRAE